MHPGRPEKLDQRFWISVCLLRTPPCEAVRTVFTVFFFLEEGEKPLDLWIILKLYFILNIPLFSWRTGGDSFIFAVGGDSRE